MAELLLGFAVLEEVVAEPDLCQMGLVFVGRVDLLYCVEDLGLEVEALPHFRETSTPQLLALKIPVNECLIFYLALCRFLKVAPLKQIALMLRCAFGYLVAFL